jgi:hypothetical protein
MRPTLPLIASFALAAPATATWSIILIDTRTGEISVASATCLASFDLRAGTPVLIPGVGGATAQSFVDSTGQNRVFIRDRLAELLSPQDILFQLAPFDTGHQTRQYGIVDTLGRAATFSGTGAGAWAGGLTGQFSYIHAGQQGTIAYAIQGNVLTGSPVVTAALAAIQSTDGDLAARTMAGMQAARLMGGDGRCSCSAGAPTSCGAPPPSFTKSAHIAYMLIARAGDREGSNGIYRTGSSPLSVAITDVNGDSRPDLVTANASTNNISLVTNITPASPVFPMFGPYPTNFPTTGGPRGIVLADMSGDGRPDIVVADTTTNNVTVCRGVAPGAFAAPVGYAVGSSPRAVAVGAFDAAAGLDTAAACFSANTVALRPGDNAGGLGALTSIPVEAGPIDLAAAQLAGSAATDLAVMCRTANRLVILQGDGEGGFTSAGSVATASGPAAVAAGDFDNDGDTDLAVGCDLTPCVQVFRNDGGTFVPTLYPLMFACADVVVGDINNDTHLDIMAIGGARFVPFFNDGDGIFSFETPYTVAGSLSGAALGDLDSDGDLDLAAGNPSLGGVMVMRNDGPGPRLGLFSSGAGCATGDYFMNFNIAFQTVTAPDPVTQLQGLYNTWRSSLVGRADAVVSRVTLAPPYLPANGTAVSQMTISLRDWQDQPVTVPLSSVVVSHAPTSAGRSAIGPVVGQGNGVYTVNITAGTSATPVLDSFRIVVNDGQRPVTLMPEARLSLYVSFGGGTFCYADCDPNQAPPMLNVQDFTCFLQMYAAGMPYANCDQSTVGPVLNVADFTCFLQQFAAGCP